MFAAGLNYLGTIDDVVVRYPWQFEINKKHLEHSLASQLLINGRPILLNDGYLWLHPVARDAIRDEESLLWALINAGFVRILGRGGNDYGIHEMPEHMLHVPTFRALVDSADYPELRRKVKKIDQLLRERRLILPRLSFDTGSGFRELARHLQHNRYTPWSLGLGFKVRRNPFDSFLSAFIERMDTGTRGARSYWESLAKSYASNPDNTSSPDTFVRALMNLANEMYHYNFGVMLASDYDVPVSVETQSSAAFNNLVVPKDVLVSEISNLPRLRVPNAILSVSPRKLVQVLDADKGVGKARERWMELKSKIEIASGSPVDPKELHDAAQNYSRELATFLGQDVKYKETEGILKYVVGSVVSDARSLLSGLVGMPLGEYIGQKAGLPPGDGKIVGFVAGYGLSQLQSWGTGIVISKLRVPLFKNQILPPRMLQKSEQAIAKIKLRRVPSSLLIDSAVAKSISARMPRFSG